MPQFRPVITSNIIYDYCKGYCDKIYQLDLLEHLSQDYKSTSNVKPTAKRILIVSTNDNILVLAYWNLLYRSRMSYDESFKYFKLNASIELNNAFDGNLRTILYPYRGVYDKSTPPTLLRESITRTVDTLLLARPEGWANEWLSTSN
jgi:hypothetical protein